ncbi:MULTISPECIES: dihydrolipoamide acetyltransferase family protein [Streptacidiphilus]|uniref:Dihydrolipoamide acetyltransferase component of pyruvate dehydrogenase complex n=1 Tax=Streptacidiphilus cavernicola TaxID=3342716 RepID=A0ABV6UNJ5_9ACTN|nr:dihydrolipoamide acetyltransferase family protein [Streptacidiphilus jeojiense]
MDVTMPQLGETVAEATLTRWLHKAGDPVTEGEPLFEVSTDKVDTEIPATTTGILTEILVAADHTVPVGTRLAVIGTGAVADTDAGAGAGAGARHGTLSPLVRRLLAEHELTADQVTGTGPGGRITRADVLTAAAEAPAAPGAVAEAAPPVPGPAAAAVTSPANPDRTLTVPFSTRRRLTAEHMVRSKATSPHTLMAIEVDFHNLDRVRRAAAQSWRESEGFSLTYLPFVARAVVDALAAFPHLNASVGDNALLVHRRINLGIAVDLDADGLVVPVVQDAADKRLRATAREISALVAGARANRLGPDAYAEGTFTISNPGPYGTLLTAPIINQPQVAILATDAVRPRPVAVPLPDGSHAVVVHPVGNLALTFDHRAVDGGYAARFLSFLKEAVETRDWSTEL